MSEVDVRIEWHSPDRQFVAVFLRPVASSLGRPVTEPWYLDGALVGFGDTQGQAVDDLMGQADHLVREGESFLTHGQIPLEDRQWLFKLLDQGNDYDAMQARFEALQKAVNLSGGRDRPSDRSQRTVG